MLAKIFAFVDTLLTPIPEEIRPTLAAVTITTLDIETCLKIFSLVASTLYLFWRWYNEYKQLKKKKKMSKGLKIGLIVLLVVAVIAAILYFITIKMYGKVTSGDGSATEATLSGNTINVSLPNSAIDLAERKLRAANGANAI